MDRFIFNAIMTVVVASAGFFLVGPLLMSIEIRSQPRSLMLQACPGCFGCQGMMTRFPVGVSIERRSYPLQSVAGSSVSADIQKLTLRSVKRTFKSWQLYIFTASYASWAWATNSNTWIILFLVSLCLEENPDHPEGCKKPRWEFTIFHLRDQRDSNRRICTTTHRHVGFRLAELTNG